MKPLSVSILPIAEVGRLRGVMRENAMDCGSPAVLDDVVVDGQVGVVVYERDLVDGVLHVELQYVTPAEARRLGAGR